MNIKNGSCESKEFPTFRELTLRENYSTLDTNLASITCYEKIGEVIVNSSYISFYFTPVYNKKEGSSVEVYVDKLKSGNDEKIYIEGYDGQLIEYKGKIIIK